MKYAATWGISCVSWSKETYWFTMFLIHWVGNMMGQRYISLQLSHKCYDSYHSRHYHLRAVWSPAVSLAGQHWENKEPKYLNTIKKIAPKGELWCDVPSALNDRLISLFAVRKLRTIDLVLEKNKNKHVIFTFWVKVVMTKTAVWKKYWYIEYID